MMQTRYTFEELQECPLPEGVDALRLESYLDDEEFEVCYKKLLFKHGFFVKKEHPPPPTHTHTH